MEKIRQTEERGSRSSVATKKVRKGRRSTHKPKPAGSKVIQVLQK